MSAQLASLFCVACEYHHLQVGLVTLTMGEIVRFRDNVLLLLPHDLSINEMLLLMNNMYKLEFTKEQGGKI